MLSSVHRKPGDSSIEATLQNPARISLVRSTSLPRVSTTLCPNSYCPDSKQRQAAADGLYLNAPNKSTKNYPSALLVVLFSRFLTVNMEGSVTISRHRHCISSKMRVWC